MSSTLFARVPDAASSPEQDGGVANGNRHTVVVEMQYLNNDADVNESRRYVSSPSWFSDTGSDDPAASNSTMLYGVRLLRAHRHRPKWRKKPDHSSPLQPERWKHRSATSSSEDEAQVKRLSISDVPEQEPTLPVEVQMPIPNWRVKLARFSKECVVYSKKLAAFLLSTLGLAVSMVCYAIIGGFLFSALESPFEVRMKASVRESLRWHVELLWNETQRLNILHPVNWTEMAEVIIHNYTTEVYLATTKYGFNGNLPLDGTDEDVYADIQWSYAGALLFSITVITTIGYGHITPKTTAGRLMTILYAMIGIPLTLLAIAHIGGFLATLFRFIYKNILCDVLLPLLRNFARLVTRRCRKPPQHQPDDDDDDCEPEIVIGPEQDCDCDGDVFVGDHEASVVTDAIECEQEKTNGSRPTTERNEDVGFDGSQLHSSTSSRTRMTVSRAVRKRLKERKEAAMKGVRKTYDLFFEWRRGVSRALYNDDNQQVRVPVYVSLAMIAGYIVFGSMMFGLWESDWDLLIGSYFCFVTLSTIGFGDYVPGTSLHSSAETAKLVLCSMYLVVGLAMLAMCFELMQEEARQAFQSLGRAIGLIDDNTKPRRSLSFDDQSQSDEKIT